MILIDVKSGENESSVCSSLIYLSNNPKQLQYPNNIIHFTPVNGNISRLTENVNERGNRNPTRLP